MIDNYQNKMPSPPESNLRFNHHATSSASHSHHPGYINQHNIQALQDKRRLHYTNLADAENGAEQVNFYGCIIDAAYPYKSNTKWIVSLKVLDVSLMQDPSLATKHVPM